MALSVGFAEKGAKGFRVVVVGGVATGCMVVWRRFWVVVIKGPIGAVGYFDG